MVEHDCSEDDTKQPINPGSESAWHRIAGTPELLSLIFFHCLPRFNMQPDVHKAPVLLTRVCRQWRQLALATPQLWSFIRFKVPVAKVDSANANDLLLNFTNAASFYMSQSGSVPLTLDIDISNLSNVGPAMQSHSINELNAHSLISTFVLHFQRWQNVFLRAPLGSLVPMFSFLLHMPAQLESLSIDFSCTPSLGFLDSPTRRDAFVVPFNLKNAERMKGVIMFGNWDDRVLVEWTPEITPTTLQSVMLWNVHLSIKSVPKDLIFPQLSSLTKLSLSTYLSPKHLLCLLRSASELEDLTLEVRLNSSGTADSDLPSFTAHAGFQFSKLKTLRVHVTESLAELFEYFTAPALLHFEFSSGRGPEVPLLPRMTLFLKKSRAKLKTLVIRDALCNVREGQLIELMECLESVEELRVLMQALTDDTLTALTIGSSSTKGEFILEEEDLHDENAWDGCRRRSSAPNHPSVHSLCPNLIALAFSPGNYFSSLVLRDLILSRTRSLKLVQAIVRKPEVILEDAKIKRLEDDGLILVLRDPSTYIPVLTS